MDTYMYRYIECIICHFLFSIFCAAVTSSSHNGWRTRNSWSCRTMVSDWRQRTCHVTENGTLQAPRQRQWCGRTPWRTMTAATEATMFMLCGWRYTWNVNLVTSLPTFRYPAWPPQVRISSVFHTWFAEIDPGALVPLNLLHVWICKMRLFCE